MYSFTLILVALSPIVFLIGLVKPKWILFWMKEPDRLIASSVGLLMFMGAWTAYSEVHFKRPTARPGQQREQPAPQVQQQPQASTPQPKERPADDQNELQLER